jgi:uncharacterized protein
MEAACETGVLVSIDNDVAVIYRQALSPDNPEANWRGFAPGDSVLPAGSTYSPNGRPLTSDISLHRDVPATLSDGVTIFADVYRPATSSAVPAILVWSPYGKQGGFWTYDMFPNRAGVAEGATSGLEKFEGPDPAFWCANGYAVVNVDPRGAFQSAGDGQFFSEQEAQDGYDVVEWVSSQEWCTGAVLMAGNSWLAAMQWRIAARRPPHLKAIAPWEGFTDIYRDLACRGGIPEHVFVETLVANNFGRQRTEDAIAMLAAHPLLDDYWREKIAAIENIDVPAYAVASWTNPLHVRGTLDAFGRLDLSRSWLRVHNSFEWPDQYAHEPDLLKFFDHVVNGADNGWSDTPRVRLSILDPGGHDIIDRPESEWPLARSREHKLFPDASTQRLSGEPGLDDHVDIDVEYGSTAFHVKFDADIELTGSMAARLYIETERADDADVYVFVRKCDSEGQPLLPLLPAGAPVLGAKGQLRASHRALDESSVVGAPVQRHDVHQPLAPGDIVELNVPVWPMGMVWHAGEQLELVVTTRDLFPTGALVTAPPQFDDAAKSENGNLRIHTGASFPSYLIANRV